MGRISTQKDSGKKLTWKRELLESAIASSSFTYTVSDLSGIIRRPDLIGKQKGELMTTAADDSIYETQNPLTPVRMKIVGGTFTKLSDG